MKIKIAYLLLLFPLILFGQNKNLDGYEKAFKRTYAFMKDDEYYKAIKVIDSTLLTLKNKTNKFEEARFLTLKAGAYENMNEIKKSNLFNLQAMHIFDSINNKYYYNWTHCILAGNYMYNQDYDAFYKELPIIKEDLKDDFLIYYVYQLELEALFFQKKHNELLSIIDPIQNKLKHIEFTEKEFDVERYSYKAFYNIYKAFSLAETKQYKKADILLNELKKVEFEKMFWLDEAVLKFEPEIYQYKFQIALNAPNKNLDSIKYYHNKYVTTNNKLIDFTKSKINKGKQFFNQILQDEKKVIKQNLELQIQKHQFKSRITIGGTLLFVLLASLFTLIKIRNTKKIEAKSKQIIHLNSELLEKNKELKATNHDNQRLIALNERNIFTKTAQISTLRDKIKKIISEIETLQEQENISHAKIGAIEKELHTIITENDIWNEFKIQFDKIRPNFFKKLKEINIKLTTSDLKNCAYIITNLNVKEVASLTNVSPRTVETARYRLRKKLNLPPKTKLYDFLNSL